MDYDRVDPELVDVPKRLRTVAPDKVGQLAESMAAIGLQQPITIWSNSPEHLELVAGAHRLAASIKLGWDYIDCISVDDMSDIDRQLWEIDENLMRAELSPTELAEHLAKREELWGQRTAAQTLRSSLSDGRGAGPQHQKQFAADTAEKTGVSKRAVQLATSRAKAIPADIRAIIKGTKLDTGVYLDGLKGMEVEDQRARVIDDLAEPKKPKAKPAQKTAPILIDDDPPCVADERQLESLETARENATPAIRAQFYRAHADEIRDALA